MLKKYFFLLIFGLLIFTVYSQEYISPQEYSYVYAYLQDTNAVKRQEKELVPLDKNVIDIFNKYNVASFQYAFPKASNDYLKRCIVIECQCDGDELVSVLQKNESKMLLDIYHPKAEAIPLYEPSDNMWNLQKENGENWLWHLDKIQANKA